MFCCATWHGNSPGSEHAVGTVLALARNSNYPLSIRSQALVQFTRYTERQAWSATRRQDRWHFTAGRSLEPCDHGTAQLALDRERRFLRTANSCHAAVVDLALHMAKRFMGQERRAKIGEAHLADSGTNIMMRCSSPCKRLRVRPSDCNTPRQNVH
jgi:hypothetical protein